MLITKILNPALIAVKFFHILIVDKNSAIIHVLHLITTFCEQARNQSFFSRLSKKTNPEKYEYKHNCGFKFNPRDYPQVPGFSLLIEHGMYNPITNKNGACRDHILSKEYGWINKIDPEIISHPANCQYLLNVDNCFKGDKSLLTETELRHRIEHSLFDPIPEDKKYIKIERKKIIW